MRKQKGFSLIELLIVVAIILIIAAIAIPNLLAARRSANESAAASTIRTINTAEVAYSTQYATVGYADNFVELGPSTDCTDPTKTNAATSCQLDGTLACGAGPCKKGAYDYMLSATTVGADYLAVAWPLSSSGGNKRFGSLPDAVVRFDAPNPITAQPKLADVKAMTALPN